MFNIKFKNYIYKHYRIYIDAVKEDMQIVGVRVEDTENRVKWKTVIRCGNP